MHILCLDDDPHLLHLGARWLAQLGHSVAAFTDARQALSAFGAEAFDLVLTDMSMPGTNGLDFARQLLEIDPHARVVITTGCEAPNWAAHARGAGITAVVEKPESFAGMARLLDSILPGG